MPHRLTMPHRLIAPEPISRTDLCTAGLPTRAFGDTRVVVERSPELFKARF